MTLRRLSASVRTPRGWTPIPSPPVWWQRRPWRWITNLTWWQCLLFGMLAGHWLATVLP